nr:hypothetical protein [Bacteroidota bacterium]
GELIQQEFYNSNPLEEGKRYELKLYVRTTLGSATVNWGNYSNPPNLKVTLRRSKMTYSNDANKCEAFCKTYYTEKSALTNSQAKLVILDETITLQNYPPGQWHEIKTAIYVHIIG